MRAISRYLHTSQLSLLTCLLMPACGVAEGPLYENYAAPPNVAAQAQIDATGGPVTSADGTVSVDVPPGAVEKPVTLTIARVEQAPGGAAGTVYDLGPTYLQLAKPIRLALSIDAALLEQVSATGEDGGKSGMVPALAKLVHEAWVPLELGAFDASALRIAGSITQPGTYAVVAVSNARAACDPDSENPSTCCASGCSLCLTDCCLDAASEDEPAARVTLDHASPPICQCSHASWLACAERCAADEAPAGCDD